MLSTLLTALLISQRGLAPVPIPVDPGTGPGYPQLPVEVELLSPPPGQMYVEDLWRVRLTNNSTETFSVFLFVTIEEASQGLLMDATTSAFLLPPGILFMSSVELSPISTEFYDNQFEESVSRMGGFPDGLYVITIYVYEEGGGLLGQGGLTQDVENHSAPELLYPSDGEEIQSPLPQFSWMPTVPSDGILYDLRIVELLYGQAPQSAITANPALFLREDIDEPLLAYPVVAESFLTGHSYAWQVEGFYQGVSVGASEVWTFTCGASETEGEEGSGIWSFETGDRVYCSPALAPDGSIVCGSDDGTVYSLSGAGSEQWRFTAGGPVYAVVTSEDGSVFAAGSFGVCHLDPSGFPLWRNPVTGQVTACPLILPSGFVMAGSSDGVLYSLDGFTGEVADTMRCDGGIRLAAAADSAGTVYLADDGGVLHAVSCSETGELSEEWAFRADDEFSGGPAIFDGRILAAADRQVMCWDMDGRQAWKSTLPSAVYTGPVVSASGRVYAGTGSGNVYVLESDTGIRTGVVPAGAVITSTPALMVTGAMVFGCEDGRLHCYSPSGFVLWKFQTGDQVRSSPTVGMDGTIYFGSDDHRIWAVTGSGAGPMSGGWPQFCLDSSNNGSLASPGSGP